MKKVKILTIVLAIILVTLIAFGGIYLPTQNRMENKVKDYELGRELNSQRVVELKIKEDSKDNSSDDKNKTSSNKEVTKTLVESNNGDVKADDKKVEEKVETKSTDTNSTDTPTDNKSDENK